MNRRFNERNQNFSNEFRERGNESNFNRNSSQSDRFPRGNGGDAPDSRQNRNRDDHGPRHHSSRGRNDSESRDRNESDLPRGEMKGSRGRGGNFRGRGSRGRGEINIRGRGGRIPRGRGGIFRGNSDSSPRNISVVNSQRRVEIVFRGRGGGPIERGGGRSGRFSRGSRGGENSREMHLSRNRPGFDNNDFDRGNFNLDDDRDGNEDFGYQDVMDNSNFEHGRPDNDNDAAAFFDNNDGNQDYENRAFNFNDDRRRENFDGHHDFPPNHPDFQNDRPNFSHGHPNFQGNNFPHGHPDYQQHHPDFPQGHPGYQGDHPNFHDNGPNFPRDHPDFQGNHPNFRHNHPDFSRNHPDFPQNHPDFPPNHPDFQRNHPDFPRNHPDFQGNHPDFQSNHPDFPRNHPDFQGNHPDFQGNRPDFQGNHPNFPRDHPDNNPNFAQNHPNFSRNHPNFPCDHPDFSENQPNYERDYDFPQDLQNFHRDNTDIPREHSDFPRDRPNSPPEDRSVCSGDRPNFPRDNSDFNEEHPNFPQNHPNFSRGHPDFPRDRSPDNIDHPNFNSSPESIANKGHHNSRKGRHNSSRRERDVSRDHHPNRSPDLPNFARLDDDDDDDDNIPNSQLSSNPIISPIGDLETSNMPPFNVFPGEHNFPIPLPLTNSPINLDSYSFGHRSTSPRAVKYKTKDNVRSGGSNFDENSIDFEDYDRKHSQIKPEDFLPYRPKIGMYEIPNDRRPGTSSSLTQENIRHRNNSSANDKHKSVDSISSTSMTIDLPINNSNSDMEMDLCPSPPMISIAPDSPSHPDLKADNKYAFSKLGENKFEELSELGMKHSLVDDGGIMLSPKRQKLDTSSAPTNYEPITNVAFAEAFSVRKQFVIYEMKYGSTPPTIIRDSTNINKMTFKIEQLPDKKGMPVVFILDDKVVCKGKSRDDVTREALIRLKRVCFTIRHREMSYSNFETITRFTKKLKLNEVGKVVNRVVSGNEFDLEIIKQLIKEYVLAEDPMDLIFDSDFSRDERRQITIYVEELSKKWWKAKDLVSTTVGEKIRYIFLCRQKPILDILKLIRDEKHEGMLKKYILIEPDPSLHCDTLGKISSKERNNVWREVRDVYDFENPHFTEKDLPFARKLLRKDFILFQVRGKSTLNVIERSAKLNKRKLNIETNVSRDVEKQCTLEIDEIRICTTKKSWLNGRALARLKHCCYTIIYNPDILPGDNDIITRATLDDYTYIDYISTEMEKDKLPPDRRYAKDGITITKLLARRIMKDYRNTDVFAFNNDFTEMEMRFVLDEAKRYNYFYNVTTIDNVNYTIIKTDLPISELNQFIKNAKDGRIKLRYDVIPPILPEYHYDKRIYNTKREVDLINKPKKAK